jgi:CubicO group peptidase (beta-lactamase class C family)
MGTVEGAFCVPLEVFPLRARFQSVQKKFRRERARNIVKRSFANRTSRQLPHVSQSDNMQRLTSVTRCVDWKFRQPEARASRPIPHADIDSRTQDTAIARTAEVIFRKDPVPALSVAVYRGSALAFAQAYGEVELEHGVAATTSHRFRLGSGAKPVTATLAAVLADEGSVNLDVGIVRYMPALPQAHHATTLRQLLTHRGGIRHYITRDSFRSAVGGAIDSRTYFSNADILAVFIDDPLVAPPGATMSYSTFGYTLASIVLEEATRTPFLELLQQKIATPLGLASLRRTSGLEADSS